MFKLFLPFLLLFSFFSLGSVNATDYEQFLQSVENIEILEYAENKWGEDQTMVQYEYYSQLEALNWIEQQPNSEEILREGREEFGNDYALMKYQVEREMDASEAVDEFVNYFLLSILLFNFLFLLFFIKDMFDRKERIFLWVIAFLVCAPVASIFYRTFRKSKEGEVIKGSKMHNFAKNFLILWPISIIGAFIFFFSAVLFIDWIAGQNVDSQFIGEALFWFGGIFACVAIPTIVIFPSMVAALIMLLTKPSSKGDN